MKNISILVAMLLLVFGFGCGGDKPSKPVNNNSQKNVKNADIPKAESATLKSAEPAEEEEEQQATVIPPEELKKAKEIIEGVSDADVAAVDAGKKYKAFCAACHGFDGKLGVNGAKDLTKSKITLAESVAQVYHGRGLMTPFKGIMKDAEIVAVAKYLESEMRK